MGKEENGQSQRRYEAAGVQPGLFKIEQERRLINGSHKANSSQDPRWQDA